MAINLYSNCETVTTGCFFYNNSNLTSPVSNGKYSDGTDCYTVSGGNGEITAVQTCSPPVEYDNYVADEYSCPGCTLLSSGVLVAFPQGQSVTIGDWYPDVANTSHTYLITNTSLTGPGYILTNIYGSFASCGAACGV